MPAQPQVAFNFTPTQLYKNDPRFDGLEAKLKDHTWFGGDKLSAKDREAYEELADVMPPNADLYPSLFFWWSMVEKFSPEIRDSWK